MKRLTLVRHAQAESALAGQADFDRALTRRGVEDAAAMARRLKLRKLHVDGVVSSTAPRALATAEIFARTLKIARVMKDDRLYVAGVHELRAVVRESDAHCTHLLLCAHNPGITEFADYLSNELRIDAMPTCAVATMHFSIDDWLQLDAHSGVDVELDYPGRAQ